MFEVTNAMTAQTIGIHIDRAATRVQSDEEDAEAGIVSDSVMTSERELNREADIMDWKMGNSGSAALLTATTGVCLRSA